MIIVSAIIVHSEQNVTYMNTQGYYFFDNN